MRLDHRLCSVLRRICSDGNRLRPHRRQIKRDAGPRTIRAIRSRGKHAKVRPIFIGASTMAKKQSIDMPIKEEERWRVENDMRTLIDAQVIKNDPKRLAKAQTMAKQKMVEVAKVAAEAPAN